MQIVKHNKYANDHICTNRVNQVSNIHFECQHCSGFALLLQKVDMLCSRAASNDCFYFYYYLLFFRFID